MFDDLLKAINLRDLGGIKTVDGGTIRPRRVFRSAALTDLAGARLEAVRRLGIRTVVDLRRTAERESFPTPWEAMGSIDYWAHDYDYSDADHRQKMRGTVFSAQDSYDSMVRLYAGLPYDLDEAYARLFNAIVAGEGAVLFHCAVGKDRTGVAAALVLMAAGVAREAILADYVATERFDLKASPHARGWPEPAAERAVAIAPLLAVQPAYLDAMFDALEQRSGSIENYLRDTLGLDEAERATVRERLVQPA